MKELTLVLFVLSKVAPWFDEPGRDLRFLNKSVGDSVTFVCGAQGFPLEIEWKVSKIVEGDMVFPPTCISKGGKP